LVVLDERALQSVARLETHFGLQSFNGFVKAEFEQVFEDGAIYVLLTCRELVQINNGLCGCPRCVCMLIAADIVLTEPSLAILVEAGLS